MPISIEAQLSFQLDTPVDVLLQFEAAAIPEQQVLSADTQISQFEHFARVPAHDTIGERIWIHAQGLIEVSYRAKVAVTRMTPDIGQLKQLPPHKVPGETVQYMLDSRYCQANRFQHFVEAEFAGIHGGALIVAMRDWIAEHFDYAPGSSTTETTAFDSFVARQGICRDYAQLLVSFARASGIPARYVSCFAPEVDPPDFHAIAEVFLEDSTTPGGGAWYPVDATGMADPAKMTKIGVGRDAADVSFMTAFGPATFGDKSIAVS